MKRIDFHSHILPKLDDGAENLAESLKLLKILKKDGVDIVVATPHLYLHRDSLSTFLRRREESVKILTEAMADAEPDSYPEVIIGAEVYLMSGVQSLPLDKLCIEGTDYMMLELPYSPFTTAFMNSLANFLNFCDVKIILAHVERYFDFSEPERVNEILDYGLMSQGNCDSIINSRTRKNTLRLIENGDISLLGTDLHSVRMRPPHFKEAEQIIRKKLLDGVFENMMSTAEKVLNLKEPEN